MATRPKLREAAALVASVSIAIVLGLVGGRTALMKVWLIATTLALIGFALFLTAARVAVPPRLSRFILMGLAALATTLARQPVP